MDLNNYGYDAMIQQKSPAGLGGQDFREFATPKLSVYKTKPTRKGSHDPRRQVFRGDTDSNPEFASPHKSSSAPSTPSRPSPAAQTQTLHGQPDGIDVQAGLNANQKTLDYPETAPVSNPYVLVDYGSVPNTMYNEPALIGQNPYPGYIGYVRQPGPSMSSHNLPEQFQQVHISNSSPDNGQGMAFTQTSMSNPAIAQVPSYARTMPLPDRLGTNNHVGGYLGTTPFHTTTRSASVPSFLQTNDADVRQYTSTPMSATMPQVPLNLLEWQIQQQQQLRRQQLDATKNMYASSVATPSFLEATSGSSNPHKWDSLKRVTDNIIKEKDMIIDRQKLKIQQFEQKLAETDSQLKHVLRLRAEEAGDKIAMKFQEVQYDNASLSAKIVDLENSKKQQVQELRSQLGATEYDLEKIQSSLKHDIVAKDEEIQRYKEKLEEQEVTLAEWRKKHAELKENHTMSKKKVKSLERYLMDLPSPDEYSETNRRLATLEVDYSVSQTSLQDVESVLSQAQSQMSLKDSQILQLEQQERDLVSRFEKMEIEMDALKEKLKERTMSVVEQENEMLKTENDRLKADIDRAKQMLDAQHKKLKQTEANHHHDIASMQERLDEEEAMTLNLRQEIQQKEDEMGQVRSSMKQVVEQNQDLMETSLVMKDKCKELEKIMSAEHHQLEQRLYRELTSCFNDLQALVQVCMQQAEGHEPNMSILLGVRAPPVGEFDEQTGMAASQTLKMRLARVQDLQKEIDKLRQLISNKYAEEMGANISCATQ